MTESIIIQRLDGTTYNLDDLGIRVISWDPPSPNYQHTFAQIHELKATLTDTQIQQTTAPLVIQVRAHDIYDYELMRQRVLDIFSSFESFYVINMRIPMIRWKCVAEAFEYPRLSNFWFTQPITINLVYGEGFAESVALTSEDSFTTPNGKWGIGMNIPSDTDISYHFDTNNFDIWNLGNIPLLADERPVLFEFKGRVSSQLTINNNTTGQAFKLNKTLSKSDTLQLYGMKPMVNHKSVFGSGNHAYLDLAKGKNQFTISGATDLTLDISTRFYY